jgi:autotransporter translocation and assembly factor TamB
VDYAGNVLREEQPFDTRLDIRVTMRDRFEVAVGGLRATVGGDLQVRQSRGQPVQLFGSLNVIGGELTAYRQRLLIQRGTIAFTGRVDNPELNVRAEREIRSENVSVGVELLGTLEAPQMRVYSDPAMSQSEAMSYLIRGRGMDAGAGLDGAALALSMGADLVNSSGVLSGFERLPGISQIRLGAEGTADDTAATVSGYVGERLYVAYGIGLYEPITVLTARLYLSARLWLEVVSRLENSLDLYYSFDIR